MPGRLLGPHGLSDQTIRPSARIAVDRPLIWSRRAPLTAAGVSIRPADVDSPGKEPSLVGVGGIP